MASDVLKISSIEQNALQTKEEFKAELDKAKWWAASVEYTENDVGSIIKEARNKKQKRVNSN